jgi:hypothetical protein
MKGNISADCTPITTQKDDYGFMGNSLYKNGKYWGEIVSINSDSLKVEYRGDNKFMLGQTITIMLSNQNA